MPEISAYSTLEDLLAATRFAVEATRFEQQTLWLKHHKELNWQDRSYGFGATVGRCADMPVVLSATFYIIQGHVVMFYEATSQVVDHRMVEAWVDAGVTARWNSDTRRARTDANNFHLCIHALAELNQAQAQATPA